MLKLSTLPYGIQIPLDDKKYQMTNLNSFDLQNKCRKTEDGSWPDYILSTTIERTRDIENGMDLYFIRLIRENIYKTKKPVFGYMFFSYDEKESKSVFYGGKTASRVRNKGILNYLLSRWIEVCVANSIENLYTISKQRKPILIYSLKKLSFELNDKKLYETGHNIIICKNVFNGEKALYFENLEDRCLFEKSTINRETKHLIIPDMRSNFERITSIVLEKPYFIQDLDVATRISSETIETFPVRIRKK